MPQEVIGRANHIADRQKCQTGMTMPHMDGTPIGNMDNDVSINDINDHNDDDIIDGEAIHNESENDNDSISDTDDNQDSIADAALNNIDKEMSS